MLRSDFLPASDGIMCGIVGYVGEREAYTILHESLKRLEYRGYDSCGIVTLDKGRFHVKKDKGKIDEVLRDIKLEGNLGIGHTRWATHGIPSQKNAHPFFDCEGKIALVHNGIIQNYDELKEHLIRKGHFFVSETDTEVICHLIEEEMKEVKDLEEAVKNALRKLKGSYAVAIISTEFDGIVIARKESPLVIGIGNGEYFVASDIPALLKETNRITIMEDNEYGVLKNNGFYIKSLIEDEKIEKKILTVDWTPDMAEKGGYDYFMHKEINEQPIAIRETLRMKEKELDKIIEVLDTKKNIFLVACGTSYHAAMAGKYALSKLANLNTDVIIASEFKEFASVDENSIVMAISQSGETADTLSAIRHAKNKKATVIAMTNVIGSSITREAEMVCYTYAGPEIGVAATKTFAVQLAYLSYIAIELGKRRGLINEEKYKKLIEELENIPNLVEYVLSKQNEIKKIAKIYKERDDFYFIGRGISYATSLEGALKLKEISYIHAEGFPGGELKHGPLALIEENVPVVAVIPLGESYERMLGNIEEVKARGASVIAVASEKDEKIVKLADHIILMPEIDESLSPMLYVVPLQLIAYFVAVERGLDPDKPRNLAKSVTVE